MSLSIDSKPHAVQVTEDKLNSTKVKQVRYNVIKFEKMLSDGYQAAEIVKKFCKELGCIPELKCGIRKNGVHYAVLLGIHAGRKGCSGRATIMGEAVSREQAIKDLLLKLLNPGLVPHPSSVRQPTAAPTLIVRNGNNDLQEFEPGIGSPNVRRSDLDDLDPNWLRDCSLHRHDER